MIIFTQLCKVQKYLVKNTPNRSRYNLYDLCHEAQVSTANFVYKFKKSENKNVVITLTVMLTSVIGSLVTRLILMSEATRN